MDTSPAPSYFSFIMLFSGIVARRTCAPIDAVRPSVMRPIERVHVLYMFVHADRLVFAQFNMSVNTVKSVVDFDSIDFDFVVKHL
jgi:hypothetical protein